jgi:hypothetical protein
MTGLRHCSDSLFSLLIIGIESTKDRLCPSKAQVSYFAIEGLLGLIRSERGNRYIYEVACKKYFIDTVLDRYDP